MVGLASRNQFVCRSLIQVPALRLVVGPIITAHLWAFIPVQTQPAKRLQDGPQGLGHIAGFIRIIDTQNELAPHMPSKQPGKKGGSHATDVHITGGTGGKSSTDSHGDVSIDQALFRSAAKNESFRCRLGTIGRNVDARAQRSRRNELRG